MYNLKYLLVIIILTASSILYSQGQVIVRLKKPPPYKINLEDMWKLTTVNNSQTTYSGYFKGIITKYGFGVVVEGTTSVLQIPPGTKTIMPNEVEPVDVDEKADNIKNVLKTTGTLPNGSYEICITLYDNTTNMPLGNTCITQEVLSVSQSELIIPQDGELVTNGLPAFSWTPPRPIRSTANVTYTLSIVEVMSIQSGVDAMESNPEFHQISGLRTTVYQYPLSSKTFKQGKKYAWQVSCYIDNFFISKSDVREFTYTAVSDTNVFEPLGKSKPWQRKGRLMKGVLWADNTNQIELKPTTAGEYNLKETDGTFYQLKKGIPLFLLTGSSELYSESANRTATLSNDPQRYADWNINPLLYIKGIPFGMNLLFSTRQQGVKQNMNMAGIQFDPATLKDIVEQKVQNYIESKKDEIEQKVQEKGEKYRSQIESEYKNKVTKGLPFIFKAFNSFKSLGIGTTYPEWTKYTLSGVPQTGLSFEFNPGLLYIAASGFKNKVAIENKTYRRNIYAGKLGIGKKDKSHFFITALYAKDFENSITVNDTNSALKPEANYVVGTDMKLNLFKNKFSIEGEVNASLFTSDVTAPEISSSRIPEILKTIFKPKSTSSVDGYVSGKLLYENPISYTKTSFKVTMIGPGYKSLGSSSTQNDKLEFEYKLDQKLAKNKIIVGLKVINFRDNLIENWKQFTTNSTTGILNLTLNFPKAPRVSVIYVPIISTNNSSNDTDKVKDITHGLNFIVSYNARMSVVTISTFLTAGIADISTYKSYNDGYTKSISLTEMFMFKFPFTLSGSIGMVQTSDKLYGYTRTVSGSFSTDYVLENFWTNSIGFGIDVTKDLNKRISFFLNSTLVFNQYISLDMRAEKNTYTDWINISNKWDEFVIKSTLSTNW